MQVVIDINDMIYKEILSGQDGWSNYVHGLVRTGTPLEKHDEEVIKETVESIWGKPPYIELLEKIKVEIENYDNFIICANGQKGIHIDKALEIIDKYTAERKG